MGLDMADPAAASALAGEAACPSGRTRFCASISQPWLPFLR